LSCTRIVPEERWPLLSLIIEARFTPSPSHIVVSVDEGYIFRAIYIRIQIYKNRASILRKYPERNCRIRNNSRMLLRNATHSHSRVWIHISQSKAIFHSHLADLFYFQNSRVHRQDVKDFIFCFYLSFAFLVELNSSLSLRHYQFSFIN